MHPRALLQTVALGGPDARLTILIFHRVAPAIDPLQDDIPTADEFADKVQVLAKWFRPVSLREGVVRLKRRTLPPRAVAVTFDDGYADNAELALPILSHFGVPATFFVATRYLNGGLMWSDGVIESVRRSTLPELNLEPLGLGRHPLRSDRERLDASVNLVAAVKYRPPEERQRLVDRIAELANVTLPRDLMMTTEQLRKMADAGMEIGAHTMTHPILANVPLDVARREILGSKEELTQLLGRAPTLFAYPNGKPGYDYTGEHARLVEEAGFVAAVSTAWGSAGISDDRYQLPRMTPWDRDARRFGARLALNLARPGASRTALARRTEHPKAVILGTSITGLAVARNASDLGLDPVLVDDEAGIAAKTRAAKVRIFPGSDDDRIIRALARRAADGPCCLIATSDKWLRFIARNRAALERDFHRILHPSNDVLEVCLDKRKFADFCARTGFRSPRTFNLRDRRKVQFPLILRPTESNRVARKIVEKARLVRTSEELDRLLPEYSRAGVEPIATESLLGRDLEQWSVGLARNGVAIAGITARKLRPSAHACSVGTFVELAWDQKVWDLGVSVIEALDLQGFGEAEILRDAKTGEMFVIEVNPRPWVQFSLAPASGHDLLGFLLDPASHNPRAVVRDSRVWLDLTSDMYSVFARSGVTRMRPTEWLRSVASANTYAVFNPSDLGPSSRGLANFASLVATAPGRRLARD